MATPFDNFIVSFLAALSGFMIAFLIDGILVHEVGKGRVRSEFSGRIVGKAFGTVLILGEVMLGAFIAVITDPILQAVYHANISRIAALYAMNISWIIVLARLRIGGDWSKKGKAIATLLVIAGIVALFYGIGTGDATQSTTSG